MRPNSVPATLLDRKVVLVTLSTRVYSRGFPFCHIHFSVIGTFHPASGQSRSIGLIRWAKVSFMIVHCPVREVASEELVKFVLGESRLVIITLTRQILYLKHWCGKKEERHHDRRPKRAATILGIRSRAFISSWQWTH